MRRKGEIEVHLYGALRRFAKEKDPRKESILRVPVEEGDTIREVVARIGIAPVELSPNVFLNGEYSALGRRVGPEDRLGLFPQDMGLLYRWYFPRFGEASSDAPD